jgi:hypothetical protein
MQTLAALKHCWLKALAPGTRIMLDLETFFPIFRRNARRTKRCERQTLQSAVIITPTTQVASGKITYNKPTLCCG